MSPISNPIAEEITEVTRNRCFNLLVLHFSEQQTADCKESFKPVYGNITDFKRPFLPSDVSSIVSLIVASVCTELVEEL